MSAATKAPAMSEDQFQTLILQYCQLRGLLVFHDNDSRRNKAGFPDLVIAGTRGVIFAELKKETGKLRPEQRSWLMRLSESGAQAYVWRPSMWDRVRARLDAIR